MLAKEQIDLQNQEGMEFLRNGLVEILEKMRLTCSNDITEEKKRLKDLYKKYDELNPDNIEKSRTVWSNIMFFIGSIFAPAATPSKWFGKQKMSKERRDLADKARNLASEFITAESKSIKYKSETIELINKINMDIKNSDAALVDLIYEIGLKKNDNNKMMYQWISFLEAFTQCKYMTEEEYEEKWRYLLCNYSPMSDFDKLCNDYTIQYGSVQKGYHNDDNTAP